jgi:hypothetical protein
MDKNVNDVLLTVNHVFLNTRVRKLFVEKKRRERKRIEKIDGNAKIDTSR